MQISITFSRAFAYCIISDPSYRLDARLLDQTAQPHKHGEAKHRGCADPSHLRGVIKYMVRHVLRLGRARSAVQPPSSSLLQGWGKLNLLRYAMACDACKVAA